MKKFRAAVGFDSGMDQMVTEQSKTFDTRQEAEDWVDFQMNMDSRLDQAEVGPTINWDYPEIDFESEDMYFEYNPEEGDYVISVTVYGTGEDNKKYQGMYTTNVASIEGEELEDLDLDPEKINEVELINI